MAVNVKSNIYIEIISKGFEKIRRNVKEVTNEFRGFSTIGEQATKRINMLSQQMRVYELNIKTLTTTQTKLNRTLQNNIKRVADFGNQALRGEITTKQFNDKTKRLLKSQEALKSKINASTMAIKNYKSAMSRTQKQITTLGTETKNTEKKMDVFHAELLSVMFFGMAMSSAINGMTQQAKESVGILLVWGEAMETLFTPIMEKILPYMEDFSNWIENLTESQKLWIGGIITTVGTLASLLMMAGMLGLAWFGFTQMGMTYVKTIAIIGKGFGLLVTAIKFLFAPLIWLGKLFLLIFKGIAAIVGSSVLAIIAIIAFLVLAWYHNWGNMREHTRKWINSIMNMLKGWFGMIKNFFGILFGIILGIFTGNWSLLYNSWKGFWNSLYEFLVGWKNIIAEPILWVLDMVQQLLDAIDSVLETDIGGIFRGGREFIGGGMSSAWDYLKGLSPLATGGIVTRPTAALIGERGPEAVIPLNKMNGMGTTVHIHNPVVRNDGDINKIAEQVGRVLEDNRRRFR